MIATIVSRDTEAELEYFVRQVNTPTPRQLAELAGRVLREMGKPTDICSALIMMQSIRQLWIERLNKKGGIKCVNF